MPLAHEILGLTQGQLNSNDDLIKKAYEKKLNDIQQEEDSKLARCKVIELEEFDNQRAEVEKAYAELKTQQQRAEYLQQLNGESVSVVVGDKQVSLKTEPATNVAAIVNEYNKFVAKEYPQHPKKEKFKVKTESFSNFADFKKSETYKSIPAEEIHQYNEGNFPRKVTILRFANFDDLLKFALAMQAKKLMSDELIERIKELKARHEKPTQDTHEDQPETYKRPRY